MKQRKVGSVSGIWLVILCCGLVGVARGDDSSSQSQRHRTLLDADWLFHRGDISQVANVDDKGWQHVDVPHDYLIEGKYADSKNKIDRGHAYLPREVGLYIKHLTIPESEKGKILRLDFDGVYRDSEVWFNNTRLGRHRSGFTPFSYDVTKLAKLGADNVILVRCDPRETEGWWYEGAGIYRHVWLTSLPAVHLKEWGTQVVSKVELESPGVAKGKAEVALHSVVESNGASEAKCRIVWEIFDPGGQVIQKAESGTVSTKVENLVFGQTAVIERPLLWSIDSPNIYHVKTTLLVDGQEVDSDTVSFGLRTLRFDPNQGFFLNGKHVEIYGLCNHQDFGGLGIAVPDSLQAWRVAQLKKLGCNAWRTAHNPPSEALLDACDRMGMMVMDENRHLGDSYATHSPKGTTADDLSDLATMIQRDRNHPSVIMWSMCNEEGLQGSAEGVAIFKKMMDVVHRYDDTRPITSAMNKGWLEPVNDADVEDVIGVNYNTNKYDDIHKRHPTKMMLGSECTNEKTTRGEYEDNKATGMRSAFNLSEANWLAVVDRKYMAGSFTWTGFDYKGEPNPYGWPDVSNNTGLLDICGFPKDKAYYFQSCWIKEPMVHLVPNSWNWKEGQSIRVLAWSNQEQVELFLNGKSLGAKEVPYDQHAQWEVPFASGELMAKAMSNGKIVATDKIETAGEPKKIELTVDRTSLHANAEDAVVVQVSLLDEKGRIVPNNDRRITFKANGGGRILGVSNGNPADHDPDKGTERMTFHGRCVAILEAGREAGKVEFTATSAGLATQTVTFNVQ